MPRAFAERSRLKGVVIERVRAGETLKAACGRDGVPADLTVLYWARTDAGFRGLLDTAIRVGRHMRLYAYDEAKAAAFLSRVRAGELVVDVVGQPGMPGWATYRYWKVHYAGFREAMWEMRVRRDQGLGGRARARQLRVWDPAVGDRVLAAMWKGARWQALKAADPSLPCVAVVARWRREQPDFDAAVGGLAAIWRAKRRREGWCAAMTEPVWEKLLTGGSLNSIGAEPGMPSSRTLGHWVKTQPAFARMVAQACVDREDWFHDQIAIIEDEMAQGMTLAELKAIRARSAPFRRQLARLKHRPGRRRAGPDGFPQR